MTPDGGVPWWSFGRGKGQRGVVAVWRRSSSRQPGAKGDGSESATARGRARVCELRDSKIEGNRGSIYGIEASKMCGL
jgi:hypothetical protein